MLLFWIILNALLLVGLLIVNEKDRAILLIVNYNGFDKIAIYHYNHFYLLEVKG